MLQEVLTPVVVLGSMAVIMGLGLSYASRIFAVKIDERVGLIREALPGANCGGCGFPGCDGFANAIVDGKAESNGCPVGGDAVTAEISRIMGVEAVQGERMVARIMCNGKHNVSREKFDYYGIEDCFAASQIFTGHKACSYGCLGHGNCKKACPFDAIVIIEGITRVIEDRCRSCSKCVAACPKKIIEMVPASKKYFVVCRSRDKGPVTKKNCDVGCIGCTKCVKACPSSAISMEGPLAWIDTGKCTNCGECVKVCPTMAIRKLDFDD
jgi:Na+-translocating ferredoxin:NAD+ oxidoreductase subunit B